LLGETDRVYRIRPTKGSRVLRLNELCEDLEGARRDTRAADGADLLAPGLHSPVENPCPLPDGRRITPREGPGPAIMESTGRGGAGKPQMQCAYESCPRPPNAKSTKWRLVTPGTTAGGRDWSAYTGTTLCDGCYSTFRKHGTFSRSVRTGPGSSSMWVPRNALPQSGVRMPGGETIRVVTPNVKRERPSSGDEETIVKRVPSDILSDVELLKHLRDGQAGGRPNRERKPSARMQAATQELATVGTGASRRPKSAKVGANAVPLVAPLFEVRFPPPGAPPPGQQRRGSPGMCVCNTV